MTTDAASMICMTSAPDRIRRAETAWSWFSGKCIKSFCRLNSFMVIKCSARMDINSNQHLVRSEAGFWGVLRPAWEPTSQYRLPGRRWFFRGSLWRFAWFFVESVVSQSIFVSVCQSFSVRVCGRRWSIIITGANLIFSLILSGGCGSMNIFSISSSTFVITCISPPPSTHWSFSSVLFSSPILASSREKALIIL